MLGLSDTQLANARGIIAAVKARGWPVKAAVIAVETALAESQMRMIASANVPASQRYPHEKLSWTNDGLGHDHASMGMFQQQTGTAWTPAGYGRAMNQTTMTSADGWGKPAELMDAQASTAKFLNALAGVNWQGMNNWNAAQAVQRSGFPDGSNYRAEDSRATQIVNALWGSPAPVPATKDWFDMATKADLASVINERMSWWLPRMIMTMRAGKGNRAFGAANSGSAVLDGQGIDGVVNHGVGLLYRGDSGAPDAKNTHPDNLHMINESLKAMAADIAALKTKAGI